MKYLTRTEEIILLAIWKLQGKAYGISISEHISKVTGVTWMFGAIYGPLGRLVENGYVRKIQGEPTRERGGRSKVFYELTPQGKKALIQLKNMNTSIWHDIPSLEVE